MEYQTPDWVKTKEDALKYANHFAAKFNEAKAELERAMLFVKSKDVDLYNQICDELLSVYLEKQR